MLKICCRGWNKPKTVSGCFSVLFQPYFRMCEHVTSYWL